MAILKVEVEDCFHKFQRTLRQLKHSRNETREIAYVNKELQSQISTLVQEAGIMKKELKQRASSCMAEMVEGEENTDVIYSSRRNTPVEAMDRYMEYTQTDTSSDHYGMLVKGEVRMEDLERQEGGLLIEKRKFDQEIRIKEENEEQ